MDDRVLAFACSSRACPTAALGISSAGVMPWMAARAEAEQITVQRVARIIGSGPTVSNRVRLFMPKVFPNGYTVPLDVDVDSGIVEEDSPTSVRVLAPMNPLVEVATFHFMPGRAQVRVSTRIRLAEPQFVVAVATMNNGKLLMARTWVAVETNGCR